jgi:hypothetical protein
MKLKERNYTLAELEALPTISQGHTDDLKVEAYDIDKKTKEITTGTRIWLSRMTKEDGMPYDNQVTVEKLKGGYVSATREQYQKQGKRGRWEAPRWVTVYTYEAK